MPAEKILVLQLRQLGDILLTTPCLHAIKRERPKATLTFLSHAMGRLVIDGNPYVDEHFVYDDSWTAMQEWRLARQLRSRRYDLVIDFMNNPRSAFYTWMSGARERWAFRSARSLAYTQTVTKPEVSRYIVDEKFALLRAAGFNPRERGLVLPWFEQHTQAFMRLLAAEDSVLGAPLRVVLSPTHRRERRRWPLALYAQLADRLVTEWGAAVLWLYGPGEEELVDNAMAQCQQRTIKAPKTNFREMAALIGNMDLFVGNSNGPSHVAVACDVPSLQLHGHTNAVSWCPMTERHQAIQTPEFGRVDDPQMEGITLESVWSKLNAMLPVIHSQAAAAREVGTRLSWR